MLVREAVFEQHRQFPHVHHMGGAASPDRGWASLSAKIKAGAIDAINSGSGLMEYLPAER
jgi:hypothetical protein